MTTGRCDACAENSDLQFCVTISGPDGLVLDQHWFCSLSCMSYQLVAGVTLDTDLIHKRFPDLTRRVSNMPQS